MDHAAATPVDGQVLESMQPYFTADFYNPAASYEPARHVLADLNNARAKIAKTLGVHKSEIIFTSGGTEANNLAIGGVMAKYPEKRILISSIEHESVINPAIQYPNHTLLPVNSRGIIDLVSLEKEIDDRTVLISIMQANNEVGSIQPLAKAAQIIKKITADRMKRKVNLPLYFHTDATQAANYLDIHAHRLGVDMMTVNGGKIYGPKGTGALYVSSKIILSPQILGGGQQRNLRSGTENVAGAVGLANALSAAQLIRQNESRRLNSLQKLMIQQIEQHLPSVRMNGSLKRRLPNNIHITLPEQDNERVLMLLEAQGIYAAAGSACSALDESSSHVLRAMGISESDARSSLRFTMGRSTRESDIEYAVYVLSGLLKPKS